MSDALIAASLLLTALGCGGEGGEDGPPAAAAFPDSVSAELVDMGRDDQVLRTSLTPERMQDTLFISELLSGDSARSLRLQQIVERYGWPDATRAGADASNAAFLVLQHSPHAEFQESMLPQLEALAARGELPADDVAMLTDRVLVQQGRPQRYGTQFTFEDGRWIMHRVEDEDRLEERRRAMGLPPLDEYMRMMAQFYDAPVGRR